MTDTADFPPGWRVHAVPTNWDPEHPLEVHPRRVDVGNSTVPDDFYVAIRPAEMTDGAVIARFQVRGQGIELVSITGAGDDWPEHLAAVVEHFPRRTWAQRAKLLIVNFLAADEDPQTRHAAAEIIGKIPLSRRPIADASPRRAGGEGQQRRRLTQEHLAEVARVYLGADGDKPTRAVQIHFAVSHSTAAKWVGAARRQGLLAPAESGSS